MAITETLKALGSWSLKLKSSTPLKLIESIGYFGHIVVHPGLVDPRVDRDGLLATSRYTGVVRDKDFDGNNHVIAGAGMALWLGDEDKKGQVIESLIDFVAENFEDTIRAVLPDSVHEGTLFNIGESFTGTIQFLSPREAIDYLCTTMGADWYVSNDAKIYAGLEADLFVTTPKTALIRKHAGVDRTLRAFSGRIGAAEDVQDFSTRVLLLASGSEGSTSTGSADIDPGLNPYVDLYGNAIQMTRIVSESGTDPTNATARAQLQLNRFSTPRNSLSLSTGEYDVKGDVRVGDYLWVWDPETKLEGPNEIIFRGERIYPVKLRLIEMTWPIVKGLSVAYRDGAGTWTDLTPYVQWEQGDSSLVVGGYNRSLSSGADGGAAGSQPQPNTSVPDVTVWVEPFTQTVYQALDGNTKAQVVLVWLRPDNTDFTSIADGDHYELRYRNSSVPIFPVTWDQLQAMGKTWDQLQAAGGTWDHPIQYQPTEWQYAYVPWDQLRFIIQELATNMPYEVQIRAVDTGTPPNVGAWSDSAFFQTSGDTLPPATPAPISSVAASTLAVQITHHLGRADGGTFNLDPDLHHLEIYGEYEPNFTPSDDTMLGKLVANRGMLTGQVPVVGSFPIDRINATYFKVIAVDNDGNKSQPSVAVQATSLLVDDAHITSLTVSKVTAGTITSDWIISAFIRTGTTGARVELAYYGVAAWNADNQTTFWIDSASGNVWMKGQLRTGDDDESRIVINPGQNNPRIVFYPSPGFGDHVDMIVTGFTDPRGVGNTGIRIAAVDSDGFSKGGEFVFGQTGAKMAHYNSSSGQWAYYWIDEWSRHTLRGTWNIQNFDPYSALVIGSTGQSSSGDGGINYSFGMTFASNMRIVGTTIIDYSVSGVDYSFNCIDQNTQSGFWALWVISNNGSPPGTPELPGHVNYWAFRI